MQSELALFFKYFVLLEKKGSRLLESEDIRDFYHRINRLQIFVIYSLLGSYKWDQPDPVRGAGLVPGETV